MTKDFLPSVEFGENCVPIADGCTDGVKEIKLTDIPNGIRFLTNIITFRETRVWLDEDFDHCINRSQMMSVFHRGPNKKKVWV